MSKTSIDWYEEFDLSDVESADDEELLYICKETLRRLWCYEYGYANTPLGEKYVGKLKIIAEKIYKWENNPSGFGSIPEDLMKWLVWVLENKTTMNKVLLQRFWFKDI